MQMLKGLSIRTLCWGTAAAAGVAFIAAAMIIPSESLVLALSGGWALMGWFMGLIAGNSNGD